MMKNEMTETYYLHVVDYTDNIVDENEQLQNLGLQILH